MADYRKTITLFIATGFGSGYLPLAPGSWGSLVMAIACWWLVDLPIWCYLGIIVVIFFIGVAVAKTADQHLAEAGQSGYDNDRIVIDEWAGMMVTFIPFFVFEKSILFFGIGFVLFRLFDAVKIGLVRLTDQWHNRWGVMLDDFFAGIYAAIFFFLAVWLTKVV